MQRPEGRIARYVHVDMVSDSSGGRDHPADADADADVATDDRVIAAPQID